MITVCDENRCNGCWACFDSCSQKAISIIDSTDCFNAVIDESRCLKCGKCRAVCPNVTERAFMKPIQWVQGWANSLSIRQNASSGGFATAISDAFVKNGGYVCSCVLNNGQYNFKCTNQIEDIRNFAGSKYVKSNPSGIYDEVYNLLKKGEKVLFVGLPCQSAALGNYIPINYCNNLYRIDLICHGTPSFKLLESYFDENGGNISLEKILSFRHNLKYELDGEQVNDKMRYMPLYIMNYLNGNIYTENCYYCKFAQTNRVSDLSLGDAWGSELTEELKDGISLALCQTEKGKELLDSSNVFCTNVDIEKMIESNSQLMHPMTMSKERTLFFKTYSKNRSFFLASLRIRPYIVIKQWMKYQLSRIK